MRGGGLLLVLLVLAAAIFLPPERPAPRTEVRLITETGRDGACAPEFASLDVPERRRPALDALVVDLSWAAAAAGPEGLGLALAGLLLVVALAGLWCRGGRCALRRLLVALALGVPCALALLYVSCFVPGRRLLLGPEATDWAPASLHTQTDRSTGLLSPDRLVAWHYARGIRVLNVSDRDSVGGGLAARERAGPYREAGMVVLAGEEWHGSPDVVLVNLRETVEAPAGDLAAVTRAAHAQGGAAFLAHPWAKLDRPLDEALAQGLDGVEAVNGILHGGRLVREAAAARGRALLGTLDYKYGPHVTALTLLPDALARTPAGVVQALREGSTRVLYAVPGGARTGEAWAAGAIVWDRLLRARDSLLSVPRPRRAVWFLQLALLPLLWWWTTRPRPDAAEPAAESRSVTRRVFATACVVELLLPVLLSWQVRGAVGTVPVPWILALAALAAVPLLASTHRLACLERARRELDSEIAA